MKKSHLKGLLCNKTLEEMCLTVRLENMQFKFCSVHKHPSHYLIIVNMKIESEIGKDLSRNLTLEEHV